MCRLVLIPCFLTLLSTLECFAQAPNVVRLTIENEPITPITARIVERGIGQAEAARAECLIIVLDTPGGLLDSTRTVVRDLLASEVPIVVYVAPAGGRAASAGMFITLAGDVAAMAPATNIGAAHPVPLGAPPVTPSPGDDPESPAEPPSALGEKLVNDTVAWARALAELRGRDVEWVTAAVRDSVSIPASDALEKGIVDLIARDVDDLMTQLDGREIVRQGEVVRLRTEHAHLTDVSVWWGDRVLAVISNPNVAFLLLVLGFYGILFEIYSPGWGVAGTIGVVALVLAFLGLAVLPINYAGLVLIGIAFALFVAEAFVSSFGALSLGGVACLVLGGLMLVDSPTGFMRISLGVLIPVSAATGLVAFFLVGRIVHAHRQRVRTGGEGLIGARATADEPFEPRNGTYVGRVHAHGEIWSAVAGDPVAGGQTVEIEDHDGLTLMVRAPAGKE